MARIAWATTARFQPVLENPPFSLLKIKARFFFKADIDSSIFTTQALR